MKTREAHQEKETREFQAAEPKELKDHLQHKTRFGPHQILILKRPLGKVTKAKEKHLTRIRNRHGSKERQSQNKGIASTHQQQRFGGVRQAHTVVQRIGDAREAQ